MHCKLTCRWLSGLVAVAIGAGLGSACQADDFFWVNGNGGLFSDELNWGPPGGPPQNLLDTATIDLVAGATYVVELDTSVAIDALTFDSPDADLIFLNMANFSLATAELLSGDLQGDAVFNFPGASNVTVGSSALLTGDLTMNFDGIVSHSLVVGDNRLNPGRTLNVGKLSTLSIDASVFTNFGNVHVGNPFQSPGSFRSTLTIDGGPVPGRLLNHGMLDAVNPGNTSEAQFNLELVNSGLGTVTFAAAAGRATLGAGNGEAHSNSGLFSISRPTLVQGASLTNAGTVLLNDVLLESTATIINDANFNGTGTVDSVSFVNNGTVNETGSGPGDRLSFAGPVSGDGSFTGTVEFQALYSPGDGPAIVEVENLLLTPSSTLEIEVGGITPGLEHDQVIVSGDAVLNGRLDVPLIQGFEPLAGDTVTILTTDGGAAASISGQFSSLSSPNLPAGVAMRIVPLPSETLIQYVQAVNLSFISTGATANWEDPSNWQSGAAPASDNDVQIANLTATDQIISVNINSFANSIDISGPVGTATIAIQDGQNLSAINRVDIGAGGAIELVGGTLVTSRTNGVLVAGGGDISGSGAIVGNLEVGVDDGIDATFRPDQFVIDGDFTQNRGGKLEIQITSFNDNIVDTLDISGSAELGGQLEILLEDPSIVAGQVIEVITAGDIGPDDFFEEVTLVGVPSDLFIAPLYNFQTPVSTSETGDISAITTPASNMFLGTYNEGDMNLDNLVDPNDAIDFALALADPDGYFSTHFIDGSLSGDIDDDGDIDFDDLDDFALSVGMSIAELQAIVEAFNRVPEPSTCSLLGVILATGSLVAGRRTHRASQ